MWASGAHDAFRSSTGRTLGGRITFSSTNAVEQNRGASWRQPLAPTELTQIESEDRG